MTPAAERKKFTSAEDCVGEYEKIINGDVDAPVGTSVTGW
jgi:hypothetical protein